MTGPGPAVGTVTVTGSLATRTLGVHNVRPLEVQRFAMLRLRLSGQCHWHRHGGGHGPSPVLTLQVKHIEYSPAGQNDQTQVVSGYHDVTGCMH